VDRPTLVTGATGFAGGHLVARLLAAGRTVVGWTNPAGHPAPAAAGPVRWRAVDLLDRSAVRDAVAEASPSAVFHFGGYANVAGAWTDPDVALRVNALGTHYVLEGVRTAGLDCPVLVTASALVYRPSPEPLDETAPIGPSGPYGISKLAQEMIASQADGVHVIVARPFNHAGPGQSPSYATSNFAKQVAEIELGRREAVMRVGNLDARRDITDVRDVVRAYEMLVDRGRPRRPYNVCCGRAYRIGDLLSMLLALARTGVEIREDAALMRPADVPVVVGDASRIREETGWQPEVPMERTLADLLDYWRARTASRA
jgi:GDP-4-dehydro-6-deoxy-D-mannose reductase